MICLVVVRNNSFEGRLHMLSPLVFTLGFSPRAVVSGFFYCFSTTSVLHTIVVSLHGLLGRKHRTQVHPLCKM